MPSAPSVIVVTLLVLGVVGTPAPRDDERGPTTPPARPRAPRTERPAAAPVLQLGRTSLSEGDVLRIVTTSNSALHTTIHSGSELTAEFDQFEDRSVDKTITIQSCDANGITRMRVDYHAMRFLVRDTAPVDPAVTDASGTQARLAAGGAESVPEKNPLEHHSFVIVRTGRTFRVLDPQDKRVDDALAQLVIEEECLRQGEVRRAGDLVAAELAGRAWPIGRGFACSTATSLAFVDGHEDLDAASLFLIPREERVEGDRRVAVFEARLSVTDGGSSSDTAAGIDLSGELRVDLATGRFLGVDMTGVLSLGAAPSDDTRAVVVAGQGPWTIRENVAYSRVP